MWNCLKCGVENEEGLAACRNCSSIAPPRKKPARIKLPPKLGWISVAVGLAVPVQFVVFMSQHYDGFAGVGAFFFTMTVAMVLGSVSALLVLAGIFRGERPSWSHLAGPLLSASPFLYLYFVTLRSDSELAERNRNAAQRGDAGAQYHLGVKHALGEGVPKDSVQAGEWFRKAAEQGYADAQSKLGQMYANGEGVDKDSVKAFQWYRKAAEQGFAKAQLNLGRMYAEGKGVPTDETEGLAWLNIAVVAGDHDAVESLAKLEGQLGREQPLAAQRRSEEILRKLKLTGRLNALTTNVDDLKGLISLQTVNGVQYQYLNLSGRRTLRNVDALQTLNGLQRLDLSLCPALQNVDGLKHLTALQLLNLSGCTALRNVDGLTGLTALETLYLRDCTALQNVDGLMGLTSLQEIDLYGCFGLNDVDGLKALPKLQRLSLSYCEIQNVNVLKDLKGLQTLSLYHCEKIPAAALRELRAALPKTDITFPDGTKTPPR